MVKMGGWIFISVQWMFYSLVWVSVHKTIDGLCVSKSESVAEKPEGYKKG